MTSISRSTRRSLVTGAIGLAGATTVLDVSARRSGSPTLPLAQIDDGWRVAIETVLEIAGIAGASVFFGVPGEDPTVAAVGVADLETGTPITEATHFRVGSVTKTFVATVILQLVDEKELSLDDTIDTYGFTVQNAPFITIRNLLNMTSGLPDYTHVPALLELVLADPSRAVTPQELVDYAATLPSAVPGEAYAYSNTNFIILGLIVEQLTGLSLAEALAERLFAPLGMVNTALQTTEALPEPFARGYGRADQVAMFIGIDAEEADALADLATPLADADGVIDFTDLNPGYAWAAGGCYSTVDDMTRWMPAMVNGDLISEDLQRERLDFIPVTEWGMGDSGGYGLGIAAFGESLGHSGTIPGYSTFVLMDRETGSQQIILTSLSGTSGTDVAAESLARALRDLFGW
jgi:D-alanyl-D-alanine carboxypeptidase